MPTDTRVRVFLVAEAADNDAIGAALEAARGVEVVGRAHEPDEAESGIRRAGASVAVIDVRDHDRGVDLCREIRNRCSDVTCLVVSAFAGDEAKVDAILCGAHGNLDLDDEDLADRIQRATSDRGAMQDYLAELSQRDPEGDDPLEQLTYRERGVVRHIVRGRTNRQIGEELGLAEKTVRNYVSNVLNKLNLDNRTQLAVHLARTLEADDETQ